MLPTVLAAAAAMIASSYAPAARPTQTEQAVIAQVMVDCEIAGATLTDCKAVDAQGPQAAEAVRLAQQIEVSEAFALANPGRILVRMNVTP